MSREQSRQALRLAFTQMLQTSQRTVDYATKAYIWGHTDFVRQTGHERQKSEHLCQTISAVVQSLRKEESLSVERLRFNEAIRLIATFLHSLCQHAYEMSLYTDKNTEQRPQELIWMSEQVNCSMRLCVLAFVNKEIKYAETVLHSMSDWKYYDTKARGKQNYKLLTAPDSDSQEKCIAVSLHRMMKDVYAIALELYSGEMLLSIEERKSQYADRSCTLEVPSEFL